MSVMDAFSEIKCYIDNDNVSMLEYIFDTYNININEKISFEDNYVLVVLRDNEIPPLCYAALNRKIKSVKFLLEKGANPNVKINVKYESMVPLLHVIMESFEFITYVPQYYKKENIPSYKMELIKLFIDYDVDILKNDNSNGKTLFDFLTNTEKKEIEIYMSINIKPAKRD